MTNQKLILVNISWWVALFVLGALAMRLIPFTNTFATYGILESSTLPKWFKHWANFDGGSYIVISDVGYRQVGFVQAYFPIFPLVIRYLTYPFTWMNLSDVTLLNLRFLLGTGFNFLCSTLFLITFYKYLRLRFDTIKTNHIITTFLLFPTTFFMHAFYTESLFLLLLVFCLLAYQRRWLIRLTLGLILLTSTRVVGVFLIPAIALDMYLVSDRSSLSRVRHLISFFAEHIWELVAVGLGTIGLFSYMVYLYLFFGDPLYFFHVQSEFGAGRQENPVLFLQVVWRYFKILWTVRPIDWKYFAYVQEFLMTMFAFALLVVGVLKSKRFKIQIPEIAFSFGAFFLPTLTGNFSSMPRYILVCLPIFIIIGQYISQHKTAKIVYVIAGIVFSFINIMLFIQGHWVA
jgi:hypothetical protein